MQTALGAFSGGARPQVCAAARGGGHTAGPPGGGAALEESGCHRTDGHHMPCGCADLGVAGDEKAPAACRDIQQAAGVGERRGARAAFLGKWTRLHPPASGLKEMRPAVGLRCCYSNSPVITRNTAHSCGVSAVYPLYQHILDGAVKIDGFVSAKLPPAGRLARSRLSEAVSILEGGATE